MRTDPKVAELWESYGQLYLTFLAFWERFDFLLDTVQVISGTITQTINAISLLTAKILLELNQYGLMVVILTIGCSILVNADNIFSSNFRLLKSIDPRFWQIGRYSATFDKFFIIWESLGILNIAGDVFGRLIDFLALLNAVTVIRNVTSIGYLIVTVLLNWTKQKLSTM